MRNPWPESRRHEHGQCNASVFPCCSISVTQSEVEQQPLQDANVLWPLCPFQIQLFLLRLQNKMQIVVLDPKTEAKPTSGALNQQSWFTSDWTHFTEDIKDPFNGKECRSQLTLGTGSWWSINIFQGLKQTPGILHTPSLISASIKIISCYSSFNALLMNKIQILNYLGQQVLAGLPSWFHLWKQS